MPKSRSKTTPGIDKVAEIAGVSTMTVSRALRGSNKVAEATRLKIEAIAEKLNYTPNLLVNGVIRGQTRTIGLIVSPKGDFYSDVIYGIHDKLAEHNYSLLLSCEPIPAGKPDPQSLKRCLRRIIERRVDGAIVRLLDNKGPKEYLNDLIDRDLPIVLVDSWEQESNYYKVVKTDHYGGGRQAGEAAFAAGHRSIGIILGPSFSTSYKERADGFLSVFEESAEAYQIHKTRADDWNFPTQLAANLLNARPRPTLIFCVSDYAAKAVYEAARKINLKIPNDISVLGFGNTGMSKTLSPALTTIDQNPYNIGATAASTMLKMLNVDIDIGDISKRKSLPTKIITRDSVAE